MNRSMTWDALTAECRIIASVEAPRYDGSVPWTVATRFAGKLADVIASGIAPTQQRAVVTASGIVDRLIEE